MSDPPPPSSKLLPTFSPASSSASDQKLSRGSCARVFFQLFDWNCRLHRKRLFRHKPLPAERPNPVPKGRSFRDEKLPTAQMLLISDENRGEFPQVSETKSSDILQKDQNPEKKKRKRTPNVVAKLMGLETMPSPDSHRERWPFHAQNPNSMQNPEEKPHFSDLRVPSSRENPIKLERKTIENCPARQDLNQETLLHESSSKQNDESRSHDDKPCGAWVPIKFEDPTSMFFTKLPALSPSGERNGTFRFILSPSKAHNRMVSPIKSPLASKATVCLFGAATKILEPSMQPRNTHIRLLASKPALAACNGENGKEKRDDKKATQMKVRSSKRECISSRLHPDQSTAQSAAKQVRKLNNTGDTYAASRLHTANNRRGAPLPSTNNANAREEVMGQRLMRGKSAKEDKDCAKCHDSQQGLRSGKEEKGKFNIKRQEKTCRRLSQTNGTKNQSLKSLRDKLESDPSPPEESMIRPEHHDPCGDLSAGSTLSNVKHDRGSSSSSSNGIVNYNRLSGSGKARRDNKSNKIKVEKAQTGADSSPLMKSLLTRRAAMIASEGPMSRTKNTLALKRGSVGKKPALVSQNEDVPTGPSISKECITENDSGYNSSFYAEYGLQNLNGDNCCRVDNADMTSKQYTDDSVESSVVLSESRIECDGVDNGEMRERLKPSTSVENSRPEVAMVNSSYAIGIAQNTCQSSCESSMEDVGDTASSYEISSYRKMQPVSYSGKSTATILKELLMALNSSAKQSTLEKDPKQDNSEISGLTSVDSVLGSEISGLTSVDSVLGSDVCRTINTTGHGFNASIDNIRGHSCDDSAVSASSSNNFLQDTIEPTSKLSTRGKHSLEECTDECWQLSPTSNSIPSLQDESSICSVSPTCMQERKGYGLESSECMSTISVESYGDFASSRHIADYGTLSRKAEQVFQSEEDYVVHIVSSAKLSPGDVYSARLQLSGPLIEPALFNKLEEHAKHQWEWDFKLQNKVNNIRKLDKDTGFQYYEVARGNRKLVFDCVGEALSLDMGIGEQELQQKYMPFFHPPSSTLSRSVFRQINDWRGMVCGMNVDDMVEKAMNTCTGKWVDFSSEVCDIAVEVEASIFKSLIDGLVLDLSTVCQKVPSQWGA